ncbi:MAG: ATP-binding cassette domain-containing protein [Candidatus Fermentibacteraceae bacterium]|nr:ATP-binding cassette domain-containing protein [Candidatus Fermentibacteraceae bacterium]MBN2608231.1 ATP-binding cassette domain-containing protein [Candidatus Fermentibacteraceae bacterium]
MPPYISIGGYSDPPLMTYLSVEVNKGEMVVVAGPPGSGKSNLIKSMAGIRGFSKGSMKILGSRPWTLRSRQETVFVFQNWNFLPDLPIRIQLERKVALYRGVSPRTVRMLVDRWCDDVELAGTIDRYPGQLNRSDLQMLALAPVALARPAVAILDEPMVNLSSIRVSSALEIILSVLENGAVLALAQGRSPLVNRADRVVNLA